jgi:hypothetical protein
MKREPMKKWLYKSTLIAAVMALALTGATRAQAAHVRTVHCVVIMAPRSPANSDRHRVP